MLDGSHGIPEPQDTEPINFNFMDAVNKGIVDIDASNPDIEPFVEIWQKIGALEPDAQAEIIFEIYSFCAELITKEPDFERTMIHYLFTGNTLPPRRWKDDDGNDIPFNSSSGVFENYLEKVISPKLK